MSSSSDDKIILEANPGDVLLGRGNAVNFREGNVRFRKLAQSKALRYATCSNKIEKDRIADSIVAEIKSTGGRFLRPISVKNDKGEQKSAWEPVEEEIAMTKAKQTLRDCAAAIRRETAMRTVSTSPPNFDPLFQQRAIADTMQNQQDPDNSSYLLQSLQSSMPDTALSALSIPQGQGAGSTSSRIPLESLLLGSTESARHQLYSTGVFGLLLANQQDRLLQTIRQQQIRGLTGSETSDGTASGNAAVSDRSDARSGDGQTIITNTAGRLRARDIISIEQYQREQANAAAQRRHIWDQLSEQAQTQHQSMFLQPQSPLSDGIAGSGTDFSLRQLLEAQRLQNVRSLEARLSGPFIYPQPPHEMMDWPVRQRTGPNSTAISSGQSEAKVPKQKPQNQDDKESQASSSSSSSSSASQSTRPLW